jgi:hypothetical protein
MYILRTRNTIFVFGMYYFDVFTFYKTEFTLVLTLAFYDFSKIN